MYTSRYANEVPFAMLATSVREHTSAPADVQVDQRPFAYSWIADFFHRIARERLAHEAEFLFSRVDGGSGPVNAVLARS